MIDDSTISDAARNPGDETQVSARVGVRASTKKTTRKVAAKKTAKKTTKKTVKAGERSGDGRARKKTAKKAAKKAAKPAAAISATSEAATSDIATADPAPPDPAASDVAPLDHPASGATAASGNIAPEAAAEGSPPAAKRALPVDTAQRFGPVPPGAHMTGTESEEPGGLGGILALWGPLIIVGFLVLVFLGEEEHEGAVASDHDASAPVSAPVSTLPSTMAETEAPDVSDPAGAVLARAFGEAGASPLPTASRAAAAWTGSEGAWPAPPGPYRNPGSRGLPPGESWVTHASEWTPSADSRGMPGYGAGGDPPPQWVRCEAPYYWCPAPSNPAW